MPQITLLAFQADVPPTPAAEARDAHVARLADAIDQELANAPADLVVLPELSSIDYSREAFDRLGVIAEPLDGPSFRTFRAVARRHRTTVVFGIAEEGPSGYYISQLAVGPEGKLIGCYRKIHIAQYGASMEKEYFVADPRFFVFEVKGIRIAPIICYDIRMPELTRTLCLKHRVDLVLHCGAYARDPSFYSWHSFAVTRALENQLYLLSLNRASDAFGASLFCPPWVDETCPPTVFEVGEEFRRFVVDLSEITLARRTYAFLADRLPEYETLPIGID